MFSRQGNMCEHERSKSKSVEQKISEVKRWSEVLATFHKMF